MWSQSGGHQSSFVLPSTSFASARYSSRLGNHILLLSHLLTLHGLPTAADELHGKDGTEKELKTCFIMAQSSAPPSSLPGLVLLIPSLTHAMINTTTSISQGQSQRHSLTQTTTLFPEEFRVTRPDVHLPHLDSHAPLHPNNMCAHFVTP